MPSDVKLFIAHNIIMGQVKKSDLEKYWSTNTKTRLPFFGKYISRNKFQSILWNLHVSDDTAFGKTMRLFRYDQQKFFVCIQTYSDTIIQ